MVDSNQAQELLSQYRAGQRDFQEQALRRADLHKADLTGVNLSGADLSEANLRDANLTGANLSGAYFNEADLSGANLEKANLTGASLVKTYLIKANLQSAQLDNALCTGAFLTRADLRNACLNGALFNGTDFTGAQLANAKYNKTTRFDITFNLERAGLKRVATDLSAPSKGLPKPGTAIAPRLPTRLSVEDLLLMFDHLGDIGNHYLGNTMASRYLQSSRPQVDWFAQFEVDKKTVKLSYNGSKTDQLTPEQIRLAQQWAQKYVKSCTMIFKTFPTLIEKDQCVFDVIG